MADTTQRVLRLLILLQSRPVWTGPELADRLGVTTRSIRRDIQRLRDLGYPVHASQGSGGGYQLGPGTRLPPLLLEDDEAVAVAMGLRLAAGGPVAGLGEAAIRTLAKLDQLLPRRLVSEVDAVAVATVSLEQGGAQVDAGTLVELAKACRAQLIVTFAYEAADGVRASRRVEPYRLVAAGRRWYLVAYDLDRDDWRTFRLDRLSQPHVTTFRYTARPGPEPTELVRYGTTQAPYDHVVRVRMQAPADEVASRVPPNVADIRPETETTCTLVTGGNDLDVLALHLLAVGVPFEVLDPPALVDALRRLVDLVLGAGAIRPPQ